MLEVGWDAPLHVRHEHLTGGPDACRLLYVSDIHLRPGRSGRLARRLVRAARHAAPHVVLLGGDLVDRASELPALRHLVREFALIAPVLAVAGNHDRRVGIEAVADAVVRGNGRWIHEGFETVLHSRGRVSIAGPEYGKAPPGELRVLCAHNPRIWRRSRDLGYHLVLAGHLHGCQAVVFEHRDRLYPGAFFYPHNYLSHQRGNARLVVSRGVSDLIPVRWRCPREVVLCHV